MKFTKKQNALIRYKGKFVSPEAKQEIIIAKKFNPQLTYKQLTEDYFKVNIEKAARYSEPERDFQGQIISNRAKAEIKKASKDLGIPYEQAKGIFLEGKLVRSEIGRTMLFAVSDSIGGYSERNKNFKVKIKLPGETRFRIFKDVNRALNIIEKQKSKIFKDIRKRTGKKKIDSDEMPTIPMIEKYRPGEFLPRESLVDFNRVKSLSELSDDERDEIMEKVQSGEFSNKNKSQNENQNDSNNRRGQHKKFNRKTKTK